jgi:tetratricopeptide (TPR) repeat protein
MAGYRSAEDKLQEGIRLFGLKRWEAVVQELLKIDRWILTAEEHIELAYYLGLCYMKLERFDEALLSLEQVLSGSQEPLRIYQCRLTLAYVYVISNRAKLAEIELDRLSKSGFESVQIYTTLGYTAWIQKRHKEAVEYYEKALAMDNNNTTAMNGLGYILVDTNMDQARGMRLCRKAVDKAPKNAAYLDSLGWAYFKSGDTKESRIWLRRAFDLAPHNADIRAHMRTVLGERS